MRCPVCKETELHPHPLEQDLESLECDRCSGHWLQSFQYWKWREAHPENLPERTGAEVPASPEVRESGVGKQCPECQRILVPYKVGHSLTFSLDRCAHCGGVWLDANEWEALKARNLHDDVHFIFAQSWQRQIFQEEQTRQREARLQERFGAADYAEMQRIRTWIQQHPYREELLAFLLHGG